MRPDCTEAIIATKEQLSICEAERMHRENKENGPSSDSMSLACPHAADSLEV